MRPTTLCALLLAAASCRQNEPPKVIPPELSNSPFAADYQLHPEAYKETLTALFKVDPLAAFQRQIDRPTPRVKMPELKMPYGSKEESLPLFVLVNEKGAVLDIAYKTQIPESVRTAQQPLIDQCYGMKFAPGHFGIASICLHVRAE